MPTTIGIRDLKNQTSRIVRAVREEMAEYVITLQGKPVALLRPITEADEQQLHQAKKSKRIAIYSNSPQNPINHCSKKAFGKN